MVRAPAPALAGAWNPLCDINLNDPRSARLSLAQRPYPRACVDVHRRAVALADSGLLLKPERHVSEAKHLEAAAADQLNGLYRRYAAWLGRRLQTFVAADEAADVVQETYLRIAPLEAASIRHPKAFLLQVAMNLVRDDRRRRARHDRMLGLQPPEARQEASQLDQVLLKQIILEMPALYRDVFVLSRFSGMTYAQIASARGISVKTVEWRMAKALEYCTSRLDV